MLKQIFLAALAAILLVLLMPVDLSAYGAAHRGYTHVGPNGVYHAGRTVAAGPGGAYAGGHSSYHSYGGGRCVSRRAQPTAVAVRIAAVTAPAEALIATRQAIPAAAPPADTAMAMSAKDCRRKTVRPGRFSPSAMKESAGFYPPPTQAPSSPANLNRFFTIV